MVSSTLFEKNSGYASICKEQARYVQDGVEMMDNGNNILIHSSAPCIITRQIQRVLAREQVFARLSVLYNVGYDAL